MKQAPRSHQTWFEASSRVSPETRATLQRREEEGTAAVGQTIDMQAAPPSALIQARAKRDRIYEKEPVVHRRLLRTLSQRKHSSSLSPQAAYPPTVFEPEYIAILFQAFDEACSFLGGMGVLGPTRREEVAHIIISHARCGLLDPHRLALKAIAKVG